MNQQAGKSHQSTGHSKKPDKNEVKPFYTRCRDKWSELNIVSKVICIVLIAFCWNILLFAPFVSFDLKTRWVNKLLTDRDIITEMERVPFDPVAPREYRIREKAEENSRSLKESINSLVADQLNPVLANPFQLVEIAKLAKAQAIQETIANSPLPYHVGSFLHETEPYLEMFNFSCIAVLLFVLVPTWPKGSRSTSSICFSVLWVGIAYYLLYDVPPIIMRYFGTKIFDDGRRAFTFESYNLNHSAFCISHLQAVVYAYMLANLWFLWLRSSQSWEEYLKNNVQTFNSSIQEARVLAAQLARLVGEWRLNSLILLAAFLPWFYFDWSSTRVAGGSDARYVYTSLLDHLTWIGTWGLISLPAIRTLTAWQECKQSLRLSLLSDPGCSMHQIKIQANQILELEPVSHLQVLGASLVAAVSFILPIIAILSR